MRPIRFALLPLVASFAACVFPGHGTEEGSGLGESPYVPLPDPEPETLGFFLTRYSNSIKQWHELKLTAEQSPELRRLHAVEKSLQKRASERLEDLLDVMQGNSIANRQTAAMALGFSGDERAMGPLLEALSDKNPQVVQNALTGLGLLGRGDTPTEPLTGLLSNHPDAWIRNNAAFALQCIVSGREDRTMDADLASECRSALIDEEPGVRAQCASVLGILRDPNAVQPLGDLLYDEVNLVSAAAATSLSHIGQHQLKAKGPVARELVSALERLDATRRNVILRELVLLSDRNYGEETEEWLEWAQKLP